MLKIKARDYQEKGIDLIRQAYADGYRKILFYLATGGGKSVIFIILVYNLINKNKKVLIVVRRKQLVLQAQRHFTKHGIKSSIVMANLKGFDPNCNLQICSIDTITKRDQSFLNDFYAVIVDEAHDTTSDNYRNFLNSLKCELFIGLTATPFPVGKRVHDFWQCCVKPIEMHELRDKKALTDCIFHVPESEVDLSDIATDSKTGDYKSKQLAEKMGQLTVIGDVIESYKKFGHNYPAICFAVNKEHSIKLCEQFNREGIPSIHCDESTKQKERDLAISKLAKGEIKILCNVNIFSTGVDIPQAVVGIMARPTKSEILYIQQLGRLLRPHQVCGKCNSHYDNSKQCPVCNYNNPSYTKEMAIIIDNGNNISRHGLPFKVRNPALSIEDKKKNEDDDKIGFKVKTCKFCFAVYAGNLTNCPYCDFVNEKKEREIKRADGKIVPYSELAMIMHNFIQYEKVKLERNLKPNFSYFKLYEDFGDLVYQYPQLKVPKWVGQIVKKNNKDKIYK